MKIDIGPYPKGNKKRKVKIKIDNYDIWNADHTLSLIILPLLKEIKRQKAGAPFVEDSDAPEKFSSKKCKKKNDYDWDKNCDKRWNFVLEEMIFTFEQILLDKICNLDSKEGKRIGNGLRLFGKYFRALWT